MLLYQPQPTPLDLNFRLFGVAVSVHPLFWLVTVILNFDLTRNTDFDQFGLIPLGLWVLCVFVSILLHEFGHIWMGQAFGTRGYIVLHGMGGLAVGSNEVDSRWKRILVSAAGPAIQLVLFGILVSLLLFGVIPRNKPPTPLDLFVGFLLWVNLVWAIFNLLPIWPLDGGMITREFFCILSPRKGKITSLWLSLILAVVLAVNALAGVRGNAFIPFAPVGTFCAIFMAYFAVGSYQAIQEEQRSGSYWMDERW